MAPSDGANIELSGQLLGGWTKYQFEKQQPFSFSKMTRFLKPGLRGPRNTLLYRPHQRFLKAFVLDLLGSTAEKYSDRKLTLEQLEGLTLDTSIHFLS